MHIKHADKQNKRKKLQLFSFFQIPSPILKRLTHTPMKDGCEEFKGIK